MKYFKKELWAQFNNFSDSELDELAEKEWKLNGAEYLKQFEQLRPRLSNNASKFFGKIYLHDGILVSFSVGNALDATEEFSRKKYKTNVRMVVSSNYINATFTLNYSGIRHVGVDFPSDKPLFWKLGDSIGDWGYDELTDVGDGYLRHEILFSSGATIAIEFRYFNYKRQSRTKNSI